MGESVNASWTDGPTTSEVNAIIKKYEYGTFDSMTDCQGVQDAFENGLYGEAKYIFANRSCSPENFNKAIKTFEANTGERYDEFLNDHSSRVYQIHNSISYSKAA